MNRPRHTRLLVAAFLLVAGSAPAIEGPDNYGDWQRLTPPVWEHFSSIEFAGDGSGWLISPSSETLYRQDDSGRWLPHASLEGNWRLIGDGDRLPIFLVGPGGEIRVYLENQLQWMPIHHGGPGIEVHDVAALPIPRFRGGASEWREHAIIAVGGVTRGDSTVPYVATLQPPATRWTEQRIDAAGPATAVAVRSPFNVVERAVIVAADTALYLSVDEGVSYRPARLFGAQEDRLFDVAFFDRDRGWAVGEDGALLITTTGGQSWFKEPRVGRDPLVQIVRLDRDLFLFSAWGSGGGRVWRMDVTEERPRELELEFRDTPRDIARSWRDRRWLVGDNGLMLRTSRFEGEDRPLWEPQRIFPDRPFPQSDDETRPSPTRQRP